MMALSSSITTLWSSSAFPGSHYRILVVNSLPPWLSQHSGDRQSIPVDITVTLMALSSSITTLWSSSAFPGSHYRILVVNSLPPWLSQHSGDRQSIPVDITVTLMALSSSITTLWSSSAFTGSHYRILVVNSLPPWLSQHSGDRQSIPVNITAP